MLDGLKSERLMKVAILDARWAVPISNQESALSIGHVGKLVLSA